jgi:hypothetical protein
MKTRKLIIIAILGCLAHAGSDTYAQGTAFTYQGQLQSGGIPANGSYDMTFALYNASSGGAQVGLTLTDLGLGVTNGLFTALLDFGPVFNGTAYWLQIGVRTNGVVSYTPLSPREELTPTPYAITAENVTGPVSASQLTGPIGIGSFPIPLDLSGSTATPLLEADQAGAGQAILGSRTAGTGTTAGVQGNTASTDGGANAVYGVVTSTSPGGFSAGVRGQNNGTGGLGIGVYGSQAGSGWGVYGTAPSGFGVYGASSSGYGVSGSSSSAAGVSGSSTTGNGVDATSFGTNGIGVSGSHAATTGTAAGVQGTTASTDSSANAVYGLVSSTSPGGFSAALRGENRGTGGLGIGVYGSQAGSGWGVYGTAPSGIGVSASSSSGYGVVASSSSGTGVFASSSTGSGVYASSGSGNALTIGSGGIQVSGAGVGSGTAAFVQVCALANQTATHRTTISNPLCDGKPNAILLVTHNYNPGGAGGNLQTHPFSVWYNSSNSKWEIYNDDFAAMPVGTSFNVLIVTP